jgi:hypothetical protein
MMWSCLRRSLTLDSELKWSLAGRRAILVRLPLLLTELLRELFDLPALLRVVPSGVMLWASHTAIVTAGCLTGVLVIAWGLPPTGGYSRGGGCPG